MIIQGLPPAGKYSPKTTTANTQTAAAFKEMLEQKKNDRIEISQKGQAEVGAVGQTNTGPKATSPDPYNPGTPCGDRAQAVLDKLAALRDEADSFDYTGMSDTEIYKTIYERYDKAFGGNVSGTMYGGLGVYIETTPNHWRNIDTGSQMHDEITAHVSKETADAINRPGSKKLLQLEKEALYGNMTMDERKEAIANKYPGKQTTLEYCSYLRDMARAGLMPEKAAQDLSASASNRAEFQSGPKFESFDEKTSQSFDRIADFMNTDRQNIEDRFPVFVSEFINESDRTYWKSYLDDFLQSIGKQWPAEDK